MGNILTLSFSWFRKLLIRLREYRVRSELTLKAHEISTVEPCNGQESFLAKDSAKKNSEGDGNDADYSCFY